MSSSSPMRMTQKRGFLGVMTVIGLMILTLYMAFAFPFSLFQLKQTETTEIKSVIIIGRSGEKSPTPESYFIGEEAPQELNVLGYEQLTNVGKERMYLLGKFLKLRYYQLLLNGNPRMLQARAADLDRSLESAQALIAGLNPPKEQWIWSRAKDPIEWQPKAIHTTSSAGDDLLSISPNCFRINQDRFRWKNSSKYQKLLNEFRHDLQTLRANTGLEFEDDLEMLSQIEDSLKNRLAFNADVPAWYTKTFADRLAHIADVTTQSRFNSDDIKRLYVGRLLGEIVNHINGRIRLDQELSASENMAKSQEVEDSTNAGADDDNSQAKSRLVSQVIKEAGSQPDTRTKCVLDEPKVFIYMTDKQRLAALMNSLQIYTGQPQFGSLLLIELHYDPINRLYFLRLFTISSTSPNVFPEPLRVNPIACADSAECSPQQFEQNIRHLVLDRSGWQDACNTVPQSTIAPQTSWPPNNNSVELTTTSDFQQQQLLPTDTNQQPSSSQKLPSITTTQSTTIVDNESFATTSESSSVSSIEKLDETLTVVEQISDNQTDSSPQLGQTNITLPGLDDEISPTTGVPETGHDMSQNLVDQNQNHHSSKELVDGTIKGITSSTSKKPKAHKDPREQKYRANQFLPPINNEIEHVSPSSNYNHHHHREATGFI